MLNYLIIFFFKNKNKNKNTRKRKEKREIILLKSYDNSANTDNMSITVILLQSNYNSDQYKITQM